MAHNNGIYPPAPFAHEQQEGPFDDVPIAQVDPYPDNNDYHRSPRQGNHGQDRYFNPDWEGDSDNLGKPKKGNKKNKDGQKRGPPVDVHYEGFILEKATPPLGEKSTWTRVGKRSMVVGDKKLLETIKDHRQKTRQSPQRDLILLSSNQQGIINRLLKEKQQKEKQHNAEWVLADVQCIYKGGLWSKEVKKLQVILKRQQVFQITDTDKHKQSRSESKSYDHGEIIDLDEPFKSKKNKSNSGARRSRSFENLDNVDQGRGLGIDHYPQSPMQHNGNQGYHGHMGHDNYAQPPPPPPMPPQMPMDMPYQNNNQYPQGQPPLARHHSMHERPPQFQNANPFQPNDQFAAPGQFDSHSLDDDGYGYGGHSPRDRQRSQSQHRRSSMRPRSVDIRVNARTLDQLVGRVDDLTSTIQNLHMSDGNSSQDSYEDESIWSRNGRQGDYSDASAPTRYSRGSLPRTRSANRARYRSHHYNDVDIEPGYTHRGGGGERKYSSSSRRRSSRPSNVLHRSETYDDYPMGRGAEPRTMPPIQRRLTNWEEPYDYEYEDGRRGARRRSPTYDSFQEGYEAARREFAREPRRGERRYHA